MVEKYNRKPNFKCVVCDDDMYVRPSAIKKSKGWGFTCSSECGLINRSKHTKGILNHQYGIRGTDNASFKELIKTSTFGYLIEYKPEHSRAMFDGFVFQHLLIMEKHLGRPLKYYGFKHKNNEVCHHLDRNRQNNNIENLQLMTDSEHIKLHLREDEPRFLNSCKIKRKFKDVQLLHIMKQASKGIRHSALALEMNCSQSCISNTIRRYKNENKM